MTGKRFTKSIDLNGNDEIYDNNTEFYFKIDGALEKLNDFNEENIKLKKDRNDMFIRERDTENKWRELKKENYELKLENSKYISAGEWDIKDITCMHGKIRLEEWGERYHQFYNGDTKLEDEEVVSLLFENEQLKQQVNELEEDIAREKYTKRIMRGNIKEYERSIKRLRKSFNEFDEMRLDRIRFLENRLKKNGLSIYVNDCGDILNGGCQND